MRNSAMKGCWDGTLLGGLLAGLLAAPLLTGCSKDEGTQPIPAPGPPPMANVPAEMTPEQQTPEANPQPAQEQSPISMGPDDVPPVEGASGMGASEMPAPMEMADAGELPADPDAGPPEMPAPMDYGEGDGSDVVTIGDSWMTLYGGGIEGGLDRAGKDYRHYSIAGTQLLNGQIPSQYASAKRADPNIATVIMTGGGNDIMLGGLSCNTSEACEQATMAISAGLDELWTEMADDGVQDVIYVRYSRNAGTSPSDTRPTESTPPSICLTGRIRCHSLPTDDLIGDDGISFDGIHPTAAAHDRIAAALVELMEQEGVRR